MGKRIKLTKTDVFLLGLTVLFVLAMALTWLLTPRQVRGGYDISAVPPDRNALFWCVVLGGSWCRYNEIPHHLPCPTHFLCESSLCLVQ